MVETIKNPVYRFLSSLIECYAKKIPINMLYDDYLRPMLLCEKGGIDVLLLSKCLRADKLDEISELIESDYRLLNNANEIASKV